MTLWKGQNLAAQSALRAWQRVANWKHEEIHLALRTMGVSESMTAYLAWYRADAPERLIGSKIVLRFCQTTPRDMSFSEWRLQNFTTARNEADILERREAIERDRRERAARFLAMEHRGGGPGRKPVSDLDGLDAETIRALSGGTIYTPRAKDGYGYA